MVFITRHCGMHIGRPGALDLVGIALRTCTPYLVPDPLSLTPRSLGKSELTEGRLWERSIGPGR